MLEVGIAGVIPDLLNPGPDSDYKILPSWSGLELQGDPKEGVTTVMFEYPRNGKRSDMLMTGARLRIRLPFSQSGHLDAASTVMVEPPNMVFYVQETENIEDDESSELMRVMAKSTRKNMDKLIMAPAIGSVFIDEELFTYQNMTPGAVVRKALGEVLSRSPQTTVELTFDDTYDSAGNRWPFAIDAKFEPGQTMNDVLEWMYTLGFAYATFGFNRIWLPPQDATTNQSSELLTDKYSTTYKFHLYQDQPQGHGYYTYFLSDGDRIRLTNQDSFVDIVNAVFVKGEENICTWVRREDSMRTYGVYEGVWCVGNAALVQTLEAAAERYLDLYAYPRQSQTIDLAFPSDGAILFYYPQFQFSGSRLGDKPHVIQNISLKVENASSLGSLTLTLDNFFDSTKFILDQRLARLGLGK